jgi:glycosyltransferase involved in cell wall biosynthesis
MKVLHIITDLGQGGAETVLYRLVAETRERFEHAVVSLHGEGVYAARLRELNVPVVVLGMPRGMLSLAGLEALRHFAADFRPHVIQSRLDHANFVSTLVRNATARAPVVWAVHSTHLGSWRRTWKTRIVRKLCGILSRSKPVAIVSDADSSVAAYRRAGFDARKLRVIANGVDATLFCPDATKRATTRARWGVSDEETLLGCVARWDPLKDHHNLLSALKKMESRRGGVRCVLVGNGMTRDNADLVQLLRQCDVDARVILAGPTSDVPGAMNAIDLHVLPSRSESLPVAAIEAMACGTPSVVTKVGDSAKIVGTLGWIVPPENSSALADAIEQALGEIHSPQWSARRQACRERIVNEFSLAHMANEYAQLWLRAASSHSGGARA